MRRVYVCLVAILVALAGCIVSKEDPPPAAPAPPVLTPEEAVYAELDAIQAHNLTGTTTLRFEGPAFVAVPLRVVDADFVDSSWCAEEGTCGDWGFVFQPINRVAWYSDWGRTSPCGSTTLDSPDWFSFGDARYPGSLQIDPEVILYAWIEKGTVMLRFTESIADPDTAEDARGVDVSHLYTVRQESPDVTTANGVPGSFSATWNGTVASPAMVVSVAALSFIGRDVEPHGNATLAQDGTLCATEGATRVTEPLLVSQTYRLSGRVAANASVEWTAHATPDQAVYANGAARLLLIEARSDVTRPFWLGPYAPEPEPGSPWAT